MLPRIPWQDERARLDFVLGKIPKHNVGGSLAVNDCLSAIDYLDTEFGGTNSLVYMGTAEGLCIESGVQTARDNDSCTGALYIIEMLGFYKVGFTTHPVERMKSYRTHSPIMPRIIYISFAHMGTEILIQMLLSEHHHAGEWFNPCPRIYGMVRDGFKHNPPRIESMNRIRLGLRGPCRNYVISGLERGNHA